MPPDEIAIQQKDRIELAKMNLMIDEGKEYSLKESLSKIEQRMVMRTLKKYSNLSVVSLSIVCHCIWLCL